MIDWDDQDQVRRTLCGESSENEDHLVPDSIEGRISYTSGYCRNKRRNGAVSGLSSIEQTSGSKNDVPDSNLEDHSGSDTKEFSAPELDMDTWTDLPNLSTELIDGYNYGNDLDSFTKELMNDPSDVPNLDAVRGAVTVQHDGDELFGNELADKENNMFLDCNWDNFGDIDDLDTFFRNNESIFGHEMIGSEDVSLSESADGISSTIQSIPIPDIPLHNDQSSDQSCCPSQFDKYSERKGNPLQKVKADGQKELLRVQQKIEEARSKDQLPGHLSGSWDHKSNQKQKVPSQTLDSSITTAALSCQHESVGHFCSSSQVLYNEYGYIPYVPPVPHVQADPKQKHPIPVSESIYPNSLKYSNSIEKLSDLSRSMVMTPEGKIEKLRRRQQMQAMIAIQQQKQHYSCHITGTEDATSQACPRKSQNQDAITNITGIEQCGNNLPSLEKSLLERKEGTKRISMLIDDNSLEETVYYQLQDSLEKLDVRVRLRIRDSLYRLARSATERQSTSDRSSTNNSIRDGDKAIAGEETSKQDRSEGLHDPETGTNHIDRIVAHLLFHKPPETCKTSTKVPQSPIT